jgi:hypothetical protein
MDRHGHTSIQTLVVVERMPVMRRYTAPALSGVYREIAYGYATVFSVSLPLVLFTKPELPLTTKLSFESDQDCGDDDSLYVPLTLA